MILKLKCLLNNYVENNLNKPKKLFAWRLNKYVDTLNLVLRA